ncbi:MAG: hypothetical protein ABJC51_08750 [Acidobacteriota bacterium]
MAIKSLIQVGVVFLLVVGCGCRAAAAADSASAPLAAQLTAAMVSHKLDAIAARDPEAADRYIAALVFPGSQLLVVAAPYPAAGALDALIEQQQYRDVYSTLQQSSVTKGKVFFQDIGADGLSADSNSNVDLMYEEVTKRMVFDGEWKKQKISQAEYQKRFAAADKRYAHLLTALLAAANAAPASPK